MRILLFLCLLFCQDTADKLFEDLGDDDPIVRESATKQLVERERDLNRYKALIWDTTDLEIKWRLGLIVKQIEANQKFRSLTTTSPPITLKFEGTVTDLFTKLAEITNQKFDARAFGDHKTVIDCVDTPLFKVLDQACKQIGYDWEVVYRNSKGDYINRKDWAPAVGYTTSIELTGVGMSDKTPNYTGPSFKMQATQTSFSVNNKFGQVVTETGIQFKYAADPGLKFLVGPLITYTKIVTDQGIETLNRSIVHHYALFTAPPTTKSVSMQGKAKYRFPTKVENVLLDVAPIYNIKPDGNGRAHLEFNQYPNIVVTMNNGNTMMVAMKGEDNLVKERFLGIFSIKNKDGNVVLSHESGSSGSGYISTYEDHFSFYIYGSGGTNNEISTIEFEYVTELKDMVFDFVIDNIPLY